jgi:hypothetical protein
MKTSKIKNPSIFVAIAILVFLVVMLYFTIQTFGVDSLGGGSQISLLITYIKKRENYRAFYFAPFTNPEV